MAEGAVGFWSYVHDDDAGDGGRILNLADDLGAQYRMQTAETLELFVDRDLEWGEEWRKRISDAIAGTTFFIPIITPSYFESNECRQELLGFVRGAERLGLEQLLRAVYWVTVPQLEGEGEDSADEAIRVVAKYEWRDLREERLEDRGSSVYRKAVNGLAADIAKRAATVTETVEDVPEPAVTAAAADEDEDEGPGILERLATGDEAMERLSPILDDLNAQIVTVGQLVEQAAGEIQAAQARGQGTRAALTITEKLARALADPSARIEQQGHAYSAALADLDPGMHARLDLIEEVEERDQEQDEFLGSIEGLAETADEALDSMHGMYEGAETLATFSRSLRAPVKRMRTGLKGILDGRAIIAEWGQRAKELQEPGPDGSSLRQPPPSPKPS